MTQRRRALRLAAILFCSAIGARGANREGAKNALQAAFFFSGVSHISTTAKRAKMGKKSRENGNSARNAQRNTRHGSKISPYKTDKAQAPPTTPTTARTPRKSPKNGNREKAHGTPPREQGGSAHGRSAARITPERGSIPPKKVGAKRHRIRAHASGNCSKTVARCFFRARDGRPPKLQVAFFAYGFSPKRRVCRKICRIEKDLARKQGLFSQSAVCRLIPLRALRATSR